MSALNKICVIIPSLNPDDKLMQVIEGLREKGFQNLIVINDGSDGNYEHIFNKAQENGCKVIIHKKNKGKGAAIKTALEFIMNNEKMNKEIAGVVTVDGDNQHSPEDVRKVCESMLENGGKEIILGTRDFSDKKIPFRSRFGNKMTSCIFGFLVGMKLTDTQTGLRVIPTEYLEIMRCIQGDRYEYETNMLLEIKKQKIPYREVTIKTIYLDENKSSHFNPLLDSIKIYKYIFKFILSSGSASIIDLAIFSLLVFVLPMLNLEKNSTILTATVGARVVSSLFNYFVNKTVVFRAKNCTNTFLKYYFLCACQMFASYLLVTLFSGILGATSGGIVIVKAIVDCALFLISYQVQQRWIFR